MPQAEALLDTDVLSAVMKGNPLAVARAGEYIAEHGSLTFRSSPATKSYEG